MKKYAHVIALLFVIGLAYYSFYSLMPNKISGLETPNTQFSTARALEHLKVIAAEPHYLGSPGHAKVRDYIKGELEALGLSVAIQEGYNFRSNWGSLVKPKNILAKIKGSESSKALVLLSHYDSRSSHSLGASDAGSGVVTILESLRAYLAAGNTPKNDIIICITDSEELGLDGAELFVNNHPWAKDIGLVLNFEARGSGGPSNMIVETNGGNKNLIKAFAKANPDYPVASSLMYSIYKLLPNDTDSTVFREDGDIDSFFFAFIDDHYDYHTINDNYQNLNRNSLEHQGSYLMPLLDYFANADLASLKAEEDNVYVNLPIVKFVTYPFSWILPMLILAWVCFLALVFWGIKKDSFSLASLLRGGLPFILGLLGAALITYLGLMLVYFIYPHYNEIQHDFPYNGHYYIITFVMLSLAWLFFSYKKWGKQMESKHFLAIPILLWLIINTVVYTELKGAAYFIIPVFFALVAFAYSIKKESTNPLVLVVLCAPAVLVFSPLVQFFPVGLGLEMVIASAGLTALIFGLVSPVLGVLPFTKQVAQVCFALGVIFLITAHIQSDFTAERPKPNSLVYYQNNVENQAYWLTFDNILDPWTSSVLGENPVQADTLVENAAGSKYNTGYTYGKITDNKNIASALVRKEHNPILPDSNYMRITVVPQRSVQKITIYADTIYKFSRLAYNGNHVPLDKDSLVWSKRGNRYMGTYNIADRDSLEIAFSTPTGLAPEFTFIEYSYDLMERSEFDLAPRDSTMIPKPFVTSDAVVTVSTIKTRELQTVAQDTLILE